MEESSSNQAGSTPGSAQPQDGQQPAASEQQPQGQQPYQPQQPPQGYQQPPQGQPSYYQPQQQAQGYQQPYQPQPQGYQPPQSYQSQWQQPPKPPASTYAKAAWRDFKDSPGWLGKIALLGLVMCVPILNFVAVGYMLLWARDAACGSREPLPSGIFRDRAFVMGFFAWVIGLIVGVVTGFLAAIPIVGLFMVVIYVFLTPFVVLALVRMAMANRMGAAFDLSTVWQTFRRDMGGALFSMWIPTLIGCAVLIVPSIVFAVCGALALVPVFLPMLQASSGMAVSSAYAVGMMGTGLVITIILCILLSYVMMVISTATSLVAMRAMGHWLAQFAPEWKQQLTYTSVPPQY